MSWLETISIISIVIGVLQAVVITIDIIRYPQKMVIMNLVWPLTGLYFPVIGILAYYRIGRDKEQINHKKVRKHYNHGHGNHQEKPFWQSVFVSTTHCSSGCSLGDIAGVPIVVLTGFTIGGVVLYGKFFVQFILAYIFGIAFQYYGMGKQNNFKEGIKNAIKADTWALISFEVGMFGWMALVHLVFFSEPPEPTTAVYWFMMQLAMMIGFCTSYPANWLLVKKGVKHAM
ncbi:MAG TPA: DUF4396 domain-containing protein [Candidatus Avamphibacillus sp.]|nr:DUF4396 domain-containing protein [Candidatus Avamphibacillus sp.]